MSEYLAVAEPQKIAEMKAEQEMFLREHERKAKQAERKELFKQVALKTIAYSSMTKWDIDLDIAEAMTEAILSAAETFSKETK